MAAWFINAIIVFDSNVPFVLEWFSILWVLERVPYCPCASGRTELQYWRFSWAGLWTTGRLRASSCGSCLSVSLSLPTRWYTRPVLSLSKRIMPVICFFISMPSSPNQTKTHSKHVQAMYMSAGYIVNRTFTFRSIQGISFSVILVHFIQFM